MILKDVLNGLRYSSLGVDLYKNSVRAIKIDDSKVEKDDLFVCLHEENAKRKIKNAFHSGASVILAPKGIVGENIINVDNIRKGYAIVSKNLNEKACDSLHIIGVTGTNGKTTTVNMLANIFKTAGYNVGIIGTLGATFNNKTITTGMTTPDPDCLHYIFKIMKESGVTHVFMEVSAHAIDLDKIHGINFEAGVLTNITEDHLDYFKNMEQYAKTKLHFLMSKNVKRAIINLDDELCRQFSEKNLRKLVTFGRSGVGDVKSIDEELSLNGSNFICKTSSNTFKVSTSLCGSYNISNVLGAIAVALSLNVGINDIKEGIQSLKHVDGRFDVLDCGGKLVIIDYAHTPDGLDQLLKNVRALCNGKLITIFGCGGDRDKAKRPIMGAIAEKYSDFVCVTSDNPRNEKPVDILHDIEKGMKKMNHMLCVDRTYSIHKMIDWAKEGDCIVIAGKGAETYQVIGNKKLHYSDYEQVKMHIIGDKEKS